jgi:hypothetical protein
MTSRPLRGAIRFFYILNSTPSATLKAGTEISNILVMQMEMEKAFVEGLAREGRVVIHETSCHWNSSGRYVCLRCDHLIRVLPPTSQFSYPESCAAKIGSWTAAAKLRLAETSLSTFQACCGSQMYFRQERRPCWLVSSSWDISRNAEDRLHYTGL